MGATTLNRIWIILCVFNQVLLLIIDFIDSFILWILSWKVFISKYVRLLWKLTYFKGENIMATSL